MNAKVMHVNYPLFNHIPTSWHSTVANANDPLNSFNSRISWIVTLCLLVISFVFGQIAYAECPNLSSHATYNYTLRDVRPGAANGSAYVGPASINGTTSHKLLEVKTMGDRTLGVPSLHVCACYRGSFGMANNPTFDRLSIYHPFHYGEWTLPDGRQYHFTNGWLYYYNLRSPRATVGGTAIGVLGLTFNNINFAQIFLVIRPR